MRAARDGGKEAGGAMGKDGVAKADGAIRAMTRDSAFRLVAVDGGAVARAVVEAPGASRE